MYRESAASFDHLVGAGEQRRRHGQAECLGGSQIDDEFECRRLFDWKIAWTRALQNLVDESGRPVANTFEAGAIAQQAAGVYEGANLVDAGQTVLACKRCT